MFFVVHVAACANSLGKHNHYLEKNPAATLFARRGPTRTTYVEESRMSKPVHVTDSTFEKEVLEAENPVLVDFWAEWCGPCKMIAPVLEELATEMDDKLTIGKLDVDENQNTAMAYGIFSIPTLLLFKNGEPVERIVGFQPKAQLVNKLQAHLS